jgi:hypothetical protein
MGGSREKTQLVPIDDRDWMQDRVPMDRVTVRLTEQSISDLDQLIDNRTYPNRSEAIRVGLQAYLDNDR